MLPIKRVLGNQDSREAVADWIDKHLASRRNCTPEQCKIITGRIYNRRKKANGERGPSKKLGQVDPASAGDRLKCPSCNQSYFGTDHICGPDSTAETVAEELGVSPKTVKRNGQRADVHDAMLEAGDTELLLTAHRRHKLNVALLAVSEPHERPAVIEVIQAGEVFAR